MKEFMDTFKRVKKVTGENIYIGVALSAFAVIVGVILSILFMNRLGVKVHFGAMTVLIMLAFTILLYGFLVFPADYLQALSMGKVRKHLVPAHYLLWLRNTLVVLLIALGVSLVEELVYSALIKDAVYVVDIRVFLGNPLVFVTILLCVPALILFLGGITLFFGIKFVWVFPGVYVVVSGFSYYTKKHPDSAVVSWLDGLAGAEPNVVLICLLCLLVSAILLGLSWLMLRKQRVTF